MKRGLAAIIRTGCGLLLALVLAAQLAVPVCAEERDTVRVGFFAFDGYHMMDENGGRSGYGYEFLQLLSRYWDVEYEYIGYENSWEDMLDMLAAGEIDLVTSARATRERMEEFAFSEPIGTSSGMLTTSSRGSAITAGEYDTYDGIRVGMLRKNSRNDDFAVFAAEKGFSYMPVYYDLYTQLEDALQQGVVDAILTSSLRQTGNEQVLDYFAVEQFYTLVRKDDTELLEKLNYAIDQLNAVEGDWKNDLNNKYYFHWEEKDLAFTPEEQALIRQYADGEKQLVVSACMDKKPYAYVEDGVAKGILVDYFAALADYVGIPYELAAPTDRAEYMQWLETDTVTNVSLDGRFSHLYQAEDRGRTITAPYTTMRLAMVTRRDFDGVVERLAVASAQGLFGIEDGLAPEAQRLEVPTREEAMQAVLDGDADAAVVYLYTAQQFVNQDERGLLTYTILEGQAYDYHVTFASSVDHALAGIFTKAIYAMPEGFFEEIASRYTSYKATDVDIFTWVKIYPIPTVLISAGLFLGLLLVVLLIERQKAIRLEKHRSAQLQAMAQRAEQANRAKSNFLANVTHDIRTPMNAIVGFADLMEDRMDDPRQLHDYIEKIKFSGAHLLSLLNDVLELSKIEADQVILRPEPLSLSGQIRQTENITRVTAEKRQQRFDVRIAALDHDAVVADGARLRQVLLNLLSNAVKYTPIGGTIELEAVELPCETEGCARYCFRVSDNGCGMTPELLEHLFEPFTRGDESVTGDIEGTGLGMPITKKLVDVMGGQIRVESTPGQGSCFEVELTLPIAAEKKTEEKAQVRGTLRGRRFLCAEDNELNAEILRETLKIHGAECTICGDGAEIVETFETVTEGQYDAILMDIQMPRMNGFEAAHAIRSSKNPLGSSIPIIAMTAHAFAEDVQRSIDAGMNAHVLKPIDVAVLEREVAALCGEEER